jgi:hypothetical protein
VAEYVDEAGNHRDLDAEQEVAARHGWKFRVWYDASDPGFRGRARKIRPWQWLTCSTDADTEDEARANLLDMIARPLS